MSDETTNTKVIVIEDECTIYDVSDFKESVMHHIDNQMNIIFDLSQVSKIDASVIQLLLSSKIELEHKGLEFNLKNCSAKASEFIRSISCDEALLLAIEAPLNP